MHVMGEGPPSIRRAVSQMADWVVDLSFRPLRASGPLPLGKGGFALSVILNEAQRNEESQNQGQCVVRP